MTIDSNRSLYFYQATRCVTLKQGNRLRTIFRTVDMPLAEQQSDGHKPGFLAIDGKDTILQVPQIGQSETHRYSAYGHDPTLPSLRTTTGFNGEVFDLGSSCYLLGLGYRAYSPRLGRFVAADSWSPFGQGGLNAYCYCQGDPVNSSDPSGHMRVYHT